MDKLSNVNEAKNMNDVSELSKISKVKKDLLGYVITINMSKGGVGKSTLTQLLADIYSSMGFRVLVIDADPEATVTKKMQRQHDTLDVVDKMTIFDGITKLSFKEVVVPIKENLDIVLGSNEMARFGKILRQMWRETGFTDEGEAIFWDLFNYIIRNDNLRSQYDFILFDTIPVFGEFSDNVYVASDFIVFPTLAEQDSLDNLANSVLNYRAAISDLNDNLQVLGIVPYLMDRRLASGVELLEEMKEEYGDLVFENIIQSRGVVRRWGREGLDQKIPHSKKAYKMYIDVAYELLLRLEKITGKKIIEIKN